MDGHAAETAIVGSVVIGALYLGQPLLIPLALAVFLTFLLSPIVSGLRKLKVPKGLAVPIVAIIAFSFLFLAGLFVGRQISSFAEDLPRYTVTLNEKIKALKEFASSGSQIGLATKTLESLRKQIEDDKPAANAPPPILSDRQASEPPTKPLPVTIETPSTPFEQLKQTLGVVAPPLVTAGIVVLFVLILLLYREDVRDRVIRVLGVQDLERTTQAMDDAGYRLNRYFLATTTINATFGIFIGIGLWWIGIPNPVLWGAVAMLMRFAPFIGVPLASVLPLALSIVVDPGWTMLALTLALFVVSELVASQAIEPFVQGEATGLSPLAIIVATTFWTLLWGAMGLVLAVPLTVMLVVLGRHVERFALFEVLLGAQPALSPADRFYQRILADDPEEAADQAQAQLKDTTLATYYDTVVMDALRKAMRDAEAGRLDRERFGQIKGALDVFIEDMHEFELKEEAALKKADAAKDGSVADAPAERLSRDPILCVAARNKFDEAAAAMLVQLLEDRGLAAVIVSPAGLGRSGRVAIPPSQIVVLSAFDVGDRSAHVKFLLRRLRRQLPDAQFLGGFWRLEADNPAHKTIIASIGTDEVVSTLSAAVDQCILHGHGASLKLKPALTLQPQTA